MKKEYIREKKGKYICCENCTLWIVYWNKEVLKWTKVKENIYIDNIDVEEAKKVYYDKLNIKPHGKEIECK